MKLRTLLPSIIFLAGAITARAQVTEMYYQGFEVGENINYSATLPTAIGYSTSLHMSGERALSLTQSTDEDITFFLDTLDFRQDNSLRFISLEFDHICAIRENTGGDMYIGRIYCKRADQSDQNGWRQLSSQNYNPPTPPGSIDFSMTGTFNRNSYSNWLSGNITNESWASERFDLNDFLPPSLTNEQRRLIIKFVLRRKNHNQAVGSWLIDNIKVKASPSVMINPSIEMRSYPDGLYHPSSRGAHIALEASTTVNEGINQDSVYLIYRISNRPGEHRLPMTLVPGTTRLFATDIPFEGYDTLMYFYCVARDATTNANMITFPPAANSWVEYKCIRGVAQPAILTGGFTGTTNFQYIPFPAKADNRSEWVYDSALLAAAGYGPGSITSLRFTFGANNNATFTRPRFLFKMKNIPTSYTVDVSGVEYPFTNTYMQTVYDSALTFYPATNGTTQTIHFQDTFHYAGKDILMQALYDDNVDGNAINIQMIPSAQNKATIWYNGGGATYGWSLGDINNANASENRRPAFVFNQEANLPLLYDMGVSELVSPSYTIPMTQRPGSLVVRLKNFGALTANAIRISYSIDDGAVTGYYDWSGTLAAGQTTDVTLATNINIPAGFHTLCTWVEDTLRAGTMYFRDHEPYNDTSCSPFIVCDGPMNGVRQIGGTNPDFNTLEEFLFAISRCGIDDSLVVKLAPGNYQPFSVPEINGLSESHYVVFTPLSQGVSICAEADIDSASIVNLEQVSHIRFRNINFVRRSGALTDMVTLGINSSSCHFENCSFIDSLDNTSAALRISALINTGFSSGLVVDGCTFIGGKVGVNLKGQAADLLSSNNTIRKSIFRNQYENAINVQNQSNTIIEGNEMYDVMNNSSYVLMLYESHGNTRVLANKIYTSHGAGAIGISNVIGTSTTHALVANNMLVCNDDGSSNLMITPLNIIQASWLDVVYNSVKMTAPTRSNTPAVILGGGEISNNRFLNNIIVALDNNNYAFNYIPLTSTTNTVGHNVYFSTSGTMCRKSGTAYANINTWITDFSEDSLSISTNPNFLNGSLVDLRTYNRLIKGVGLPLSTVPTDMFDSLRSTTASCPGAFEFISLGYDFEPEALISPETETCYMPTNVELAVRIRNSGTTSYSSQGLNLAYQVNGGAVNTVAITTPIPAEDTITIHTGQILNLPPNGTKDSLYNIKVWTTFANDPNQTNDTNTFNVLSKYHPATPTPFTITPAYASIATITPTAGIDTWQVYTNTAAPLQKSKIYWYNDTTDAEPFYIGESYTTDTLRMNTAYYIRQQRSVPIVRITQLEFSHSNNIVGLTPNMPYWMNSGRKVALQLTNVGDATAYLEGDTLQTVSDESNLNNKIFVFGDVTIEPGQSLVVQFATGTPSNPSMTIHTGAPLSSFSMSWNKKVAFVYRKNGAIEDLVAINAVSATTNWSSLNVPSYVWIGTGITISNNTIGGLVRTAFNGNASDWQLATNETPMFLNTNDPSWVRYTENGCEGRFAKITVSLLNAPDNDLHLETPVLPASQCSMGNEDITITVHNYGILPVDSLVLNYCAGGDTISETIHSGIPANGVITHTFTQQLNMAFNQDSVVTVKVWADALTTDLIRNNDTSIASTTSHFTPDAPSLFSDRVVQYAHRDTLTVTEFSQSLTPIWYNYNMNAVDTGYTHITDILYYGGIMGVSWIHTLRQDGLIGNGTLVSNDSDPSPYNVKNKHSRQQYIYSASELRAAGIEAGPINAIHFYLDTVGNHPSHTLYNYTIGIGASIDTIFNNTTDWRTTQTVFYRNQMTLADAQDHGWVRHAFNQPFEWDGESNMVVEINYNIPTTINNGNKTRYTTKSNTTLHKYNAAEIAPTVAGTRGNKRPNLMFDSIIYGCESPISTFNVEVTNIPLVDMALSWPDGSDTIHYSSCDSISLYVNVRNQGSTDCNGVTIYYHLDSHPIDSLIIAGNIAANLSLNEQLFKKPLSPGRHTITAIVSMLGDQTSSNDTVIQSFVVHFCRGTYTIALSDADFCSFGEAIDSLNVAGIEGPVVFQIADGTYEEQVILNTIEGSSSTNTISFIGTGNNVLLTAATSQANNYVMSLDSASNIILSKFRIESRPASGNYANALILQKGSNITIDSMYIKVKGSVNNASASCVVLNGNISNLTMTNNVLDSGYYSLKSNNSGYSNILITNNTFRNFWSQGVNLRGVTNLEITSNEITSGVSIANRMLTGIYLAQVESNFMIQKNKVYLIDNQSGGKRGIQLSNIIGSADNKGHIINNMIGTEGVMPNNANSAQVSGGIWIDSSSSHVNVLYNTVRVCNGHTTDYSEKSHAFFAGATVSNLQVMNNIFSNFGKGYAYYVSELNTVTASNFNAYYTQSSRPYHWKNDAMSLNALQTANHTDGNSVFDEPYFISTNDLHLLMTNFVSLAQYNPDVMEDIDGRLRLQIPAPTIGAHEMEVKTHDMAVVRIVSPSMPSNINAFNSTNPPPNIESDPVQVTAQFYNNGQSTENNVQWYAYIEGHEATTRTAPQNLGTIQPAQMKSATVTMNTILGITDTAQVHVVVEIPVDNLPDNNNIMVPFYLAPAYNFGVTGMTTSETGCYLHNTTIGIKLKNEGFKTIPAGTELTIGYYTEVSSPQNLVISTLNDSVEELTTLNQDLYVGNDVTVNFSTPANLYPTDTALDIKVRIKGWCNYEYDVTASNDSTLVSKAKIIDSYYTPASPIGHDTTFAYGTWGAVRAEQENRLPIRWYRDSTASPYYSPSSYNTSTRWNNTPQYFNDSTYYLNCITPKGCQSSFSEVTVHVTNPIPNDIAFDSLLTPIGERVYMENDTVRVRIVNYGTSTQSNIPVSYQLKRGNNVIQEVTEIISASVASGQKYVHTFNELLEIPTPTEAQNYTLLVWSDLATDAVRRNDTIRTAHTFRSLPESTYDPTGSSNPSFDITRVSFNEIDFDIPPLGRGLTILSDYNNPDNPEYPVLHVMRGTADSLIVELTQLDATARPARYRIWVMIDFDRSGTFSTNEVVVNGDIFYNTEPFSSFVTIPTSASYGYMRMRIVVGTNEELNNLSDAPTTGIPSDKDGHTMDFLLFVDAEPVSTDLAITQIVSPRSYLITDNEAHVVSFRIANKGTQSITNSVFNFKFEGDTIDNTATGSVSHNGTLQPGSSAVVSLPAHMFPLGLSTLTITHNTPGDTITSNDTLRYEYYQFRTITLTIDDNFDDENMWYAPSGYNNFSYNYWELGTPAKNRISTANSEPNAWVTGLTGTISTGTRGNVSYLYSPIIDISQIKPDTLSFYLRRNLSNGSSMHLEFFNYENKWVKVVGDSNDAWYNNLDDNVFDNNTAGVDYSHCWIATNSFSGDFRENLQFRFVYTTPTTSTPSSSFGEGCAIDNFRLGRARRAGDVGVIDITQPTITQYGRTYSPEVVVKNFGTDTVRSVQVGYTHFGSYLAKEATFRCNIPPSQTDTFLFEMPFTVTSDYPEEFTLTAFTISSNDIYKDNDTFMVNYMLSPLDDDISAHEFLYPLDRVIAGDTAVRVTLRIRNFGSNPISTATASYLVNGQQRVDEEIDFQSYLGRPLQSLEYFNYTFQQKLRAPMGLMRMTGIVKSPQNEYIYNDTITKRVEAVSSVTDIAAAAVLIDTSDFNHVRIQLIIENRGARGANGFEVGYILDDDSLHRETYYRDQPLAKLSRGTHMFNTVLPPRADRYPNVLGFVHLEGDIDNSNDSTKIQDNYFSDLEAVKVLVEENAEPDCNVRLQITNRGDLTIDNRLIQARATINGNSLSTDVYRYIEPGDTIHIQFDRKIPKSPTRTYTGIGRMIFTENAAHMNNNSTTLVEVSNYFEGVPSVEENELILDQNYPNPFTKQTTIPFSLPNAAQIHFFVMDAMGHIIHSFNRNYDAGSHTLTIDMDSYGSGVYFYGIEVDGQRRMKKMILR